MVEFLLHRERKLDVKTDVAVKRLEKDNSQLQSRGARNQPNRSPRRQDQNREVSRRQVVRRQGYGFGRASSSETVFIHFNAVEGAEVLTIGTDARTQVGSDGARARESIEYAGPGDVARGRRDQSGATGETRGDVDGRTGS